MEEVKSEAKSLTRFDLTHRLSPFLDVHLTFLLLEFLEKQRMYVVEDLKRAKLELITHTNMVDLAQDIQRELHGRESEELAKRHADLVSQLDHLMAETKPLRELTADTAKFDQLCHDGKFTPVHLHESLNIPREVIDAFYDLGKFQFESGEYPTSVQTLRSFMLLDDKSEKGCAALWGKLAGEILCGDWVAATADVKAMQTLIDTRASHELRDRAGLPPLSALEELQQRNWLLHWSLFLCFATEQGRPALLELFMQEKNLAAVATSCPWLLRYLTAAAVGGKARRDVLKAVVRVVQQEAHTYRDPITEFAECLFVHFDFDAAQEKLAECEQVFATDYFLAFDPEFRPVFMDSARRLIFETYARIHRKIDITMLARRLSMPQDEAERWVVTLIGRAGLDAKIDCQANCLTMGTRQRSIYQQVMEKTHDLTYRSSVLVDSLGGTEG